MKLACVLLNYNDVDTTIEAICNAEKIEKINNIIVVDNCSPDGDYQLLKAYANERVHVYKTDHNGGYGFGNNYGIAMAKEMASTHVIIANPDVTFDAACVDELMFLFEKYKKCAVAAPCTLYRGKYCFSRLPSVKEVIVESSSIHNKLFGRTTEYTGKIIDLDYVVCDEVVGAMLAIDIEKLGLPIYDEKMFLYCEEWVLGVKAKKAGYQTIVSTKAEYFHSLSHSIDSEYHGLYKKRKLSNKSKLYYLQEYLGVDRMGLFFARLWFQIVLLEAFVMDMINKICDSKN